MRSAGLLSVLACCLSTTALQAVLRAPQDGSGPPAEAAVASVRVVAIDPMQPAELRAREPLYLRIAYRAEAPLRFQARGYLADREVQRGASMNPAPAYAAGNGEALAWIAFDGLARLDEVRVIVFDERWRELLQVRHPIDVVWNGLPPVGRTPAAWATELSAVQQRMTSVAMSSMNEDGGAGWTVLFMFAGLSVPGYWLLQLYAWRRARGPWRRWSMLPLWVTLPLLAHMIVALLAGSNLWPLLMLIASPFAFSYLAVVTIAGGRRRDA